MRLARVLQQPITQSLKLTISEKRFADAEKVNGLRYAKQRGDDHHAAKRALQKGPRSLLAHNLLETIQNSLVRVLTGSAGQNLQTSFDDIDWIDGDRGDTASSATRHKRMVKWNVVCTRNLWSKVFEMSEERKVDE